MAEQSLRREIKLARQRLLAADRLWIGGCYADALRLHVSGMKSMLEVARAHAPATTIEVPEEDELATLPELDEDVGPRERALRERVRNAQASAIAALIGTLPVDHEKRRRRLRIALASLAVLSLIVAVVFARRPTLSATATTILTPANAARMAIDGDVMTEWLMPDGATGSLEIRLAPPRAVHRVRLLNAQNPGHNDRGTAKYVLHVIDRGAEVRTIPGELAGSVTVPPWQAVTVDVARADTIRIEVTAFHGKGGGLAEVEVE